MEIVALTADNGHFTASDGCQLSACQCARVVTHVNQTHLRTYLHQQRLVVFACHVARQCSKQPRHTICTAERRPYAHTTRQVAVHAHSTYAPPPAIAAMGNACADGDNSTAATAIVTHVDTQRDHTRRDDRQRGAAECCRARGLSCGRTTRARCRAASTSRWRGRRHTAVCRAASANER
jgi:hypothetical protein